MKQIKKALLLVVIAFTFFTCSKDDPAAPTIVGTWLETTYTFSSCDQSSDNGTGPCGAECSTITFNSDGTYSQSTPGAAPDTGTYTITGNSITVDGNTLPFVLTATTLTVSGIDNFMRDNAGEPDGEDNCLLAIVLTRQ